MIFNKLYLICSLLERHCTVRIYISTSVLPEEVNYRVCPGRRLAGSARTPPFFCLLLQSCGVVELQPPTQEAEEVQMQLLHLEASSI